MSSRDSSMLPRWATPRKLDTSNGTYDNNDQSGISNTVNAEEDPNEALAASREILDRLRKWDQWWVRRRESLTSYLLSKIYPRPPPCPSRAELRRLALAFFPPRATGIKVELCDLGEGRLERHDTTIDKLEPYLRSKPDWNIRDSFIKAGMEAGSRVAWYEHAGQDLSCEAVSLRDKQYLQDQLDVFNVLRDFDSLMDDHDIRSISGTRGFARSGMQQELQTTAINNDVGTTFWHLTLTDIPWQLGEGTRTSLLDTDLGINPASTTVQDQFLSRHPSYEDAVLVRSLFQCYHRDGFVLTLSPLAGTSFINQTWVQELSSQPNKRAANDKKSVIGYFMNRKIEGTVNSNGTNLSVCIAKRKLDFLEKLLRDYEDVLANPDLAEQVDVPRDRSVLVADAQTCELAIKSIKNAIGRIRAEHEELPGILSDLKSSLHDLFQLRTIEQNELAIIAESNNKAILVFTVVTIVFLPLSFFTSYFGMNIENTSAVLSGQGYFWGVCGSITLVIVTFTLLYGFRDRLYGWLWGREIDTRPGGLSYTIAPTSTEGFSGSHTRWRHILGTEGFSSNGAVLVCHPFLLAVPESQVVNKDSKRIPNTCPCCLRSFRPVQQKKECSHHIKLFVRSSVAFQPSQARPDRLLIYGSTQRTVR
ncbi:MAG: hypothetical protein Q9173_005027 [Seirophora scorigena]